jgi:peptide subunit release factor 1 (eRF1)
MQTNQITPQTLRRLAEIRPEGAKVLTLYLNLDPTEFATPQARSTAIRSLLDDAERRLRDGDSLDHQQRMALREDLERVREFFQGQEFAKGAHGLAVFCSGPAGLFEVIKLPRPVANEVCIDERPHLEPLVDIGPAGRWCVALINRRTGRILRGNGEQLDETDVIADDVHRRHDQGGWSQKRFQRGIDKEAEDHVKNVLDILFRQFKRSPFDRLLLGAPEEQRPEIEAKLHAYLRERLAGYIDIDIENATVEEIRRVAAPVMERDEVRREREALDRLREGMGAGGRATAGIDDVLEALNERRVEILLFDEGFAVPGGACPACGWLGVSLDHCPVDGTELEQRDDIVERAVEAALAQSAEVLVVRHHQDLGSLGSIGAVLRF